MTKPNLNLLQLSGYPIFEQLKLEEALLRTSHENWCILNHGAPPAIVMGISGCPKTLLHEELVKAKPIPVIRRFSGGGTVVTDEDTIFATFICNSQELNVTCYPHHVFEWSKTIYSPVFGEFGFALVENDYVMGNKKFGGNAQYIRQNRWLHHSSLLWRFKTEHMEYLKMPPKRPNYRQSRSHEEFLCGLENYIPSREMVVKKIFDSVNNFFLVKKTRLELATESLKEPHRQATTLIGI